MSIIKDIYCSELTFHTCNKWMWIKSCDVSIVPSRGKGGHSVITDVLAVYGTSKNWLKYES